MEEEFSFEDEITNENIDEYMAYFKPLPLKKKQSIIYEQLRLLAGFTNNMCNELNIKNEMIINRELVDLNKEDYTEDDFSEAVIVLLSSIQNSICDYASGISDYLDKIEINESQQ